ncbi:MAG: hypothetical protein WA637_01690 [Terriglobales bacterium]
MNSFDFLFKKENSLKPSDPSDPKRPSPPLRPWTANREGPYTHVRWGGDYGERCCEENWLGSDLPALGADLGTFAQRSVGPWDLGQKTRRLSAGRRITYHIPPNDMVLTVELQLDGREVPVMLGDKPSGETMAIKRVDDHHMTAPGAIPRAERQTKCNSNSRRKRGYL